MIKKDPYTFPSLVLLGLGLFDLVRGFMHTFNIYWAVDFFAKLDLSVAREAQLILLAAFGISNYLTGFIFILISQKAKHLSIYLLSFILLAYGLGVIAMQLVGIDRGPNAFSGMYFMMVYFVVCFLTILKYQWDKKQSL